VPGAFQRNAFQNDAFQVDHILYPAGIPTGEAFGVPSIVAVIEPTGIPSGEVFGIPAIGVVIYPVGIPSGEAFGVPTLIPIIPPQPITFGWFDDEEMPAEKKLPVDDDYILVMLSRWLP
jgi:hypothetical protein